METNNMGSMGNLATSITPAAAAVGLGADILQQAFPHLQIGANDTIYAMVLLTFVAHLIKVWWASHGG